ncbi:MAG: hypothetical protein AAFX99_09765, partial [Myxococcota bacterium]
MHTARFIPLVLLLVTLGCTDRSYTTANTDSNVGPTSNTDVEQNPPPDTCALDVYSAEVGLVALDMESVVHPVPFLSNGALLFHDSGISPSNAGAAVPDLEILQLLPDSPQFQQVTFNDVDDFIVDANQGWALIQQQQRGGNSSTMALLNVEQPNSQAVVPLPTSDTGGIIFDLGDEVMSHLSRVEPGAAIWLSESGLILWTEQQGARRLTEERVQFPDLEQGRVVWSMWKDNGTRAVQLW